MNIEELSKSQLILLTILVNFVTSIATGILTVSLLDNAPPYVTQTVNRVVEHTIETVAAAAPAAAVQAPAPSTQDLVTSALAADAARSVAIYALDTGTSTPAAAVGTYIAKSQIIVTAALDALPKEALIEFQDGSFAPASLAHQGGGVAIYGFGNKAVLPKVSSPTLLASSDLALGQTVLAIGIDGSAASGIVSRVDKSGVHTTLPDIGAGSAAVDLQGNLIGIGAGGSAGLIYSSDKIKSLLTATSTPSAASSAPTSTSS